MIHSNCLLSLILILYLSVLPISAQEYDYPRNGEGITLFLQRHKRVGEALQKDFIELNKNKLGKNNSLILGVKYKLPPIEATNPIVPKQGYDPLFGKGLAVYKVSSNRLNGACFYVVSGHGGPDPGAIGHINGHDMHEDEYAYDIVLRLARCLMINGAKVHVIIQDSNDGIRHEKFLKNSKTETCMGSSIPLNQVERLQQRCDKINTLSRQTNERYKRAIFVHIDSRSKNKQIDVFFYHMPKNSYSKHLANTMRNTFEQKYHMFQPGRGFNGIVAERDLYVLCNTLVPSVLVEVGNIQNTNDQQRIVLHANRQALASWMCDGFIADYTTYKKRNKK